MRIAYIAPRWDYGDPARGPSVEEMTFHSALRAMGHDVHHYDFWDRDQAVGRTAMNRELLDFVRQVEPDFAFFVLFKDEVAIATIEAITKSGVTTCNWFCDDHWRFDSFSRHYAPAFSLVATTDEQAVPRYHAAGYKRVVLTQWAWNPASYTPSERDPRHEVSFVGQRYGDRPRFVRAMRRAGLSVDCYGRGWESGRLGHEGMVDLFATSRVNLNFSKAFRGRIFSRRPLTFQIKARVFEVLGCGGFLLTERAPGLERYLEPGQELAVFERPADAVREARRWLADDEARMAVARRGQERVAREHTYEQRFEQIFHAAGLA